MMMESRFIQALCVFLFTLMVVYCSWLKASYGQSPLFYLSANIRCEPYSRVSKGLRSLKQEIRTVAVTSRDTDTVEMWTDGKGGDWVLILHRATESDGEWGCYMNVGEGVVDTKQFIEKGLSQ